MFKNARRFAAAVFGVGMLVSAGTSAAISADLWAPPETDLHRPDDRSAIWQGLFLGATLGHGWGSSDADFGPHAIVAKGLIGGLHGGYNRQIGGFVFGVEGDYGSSGMHGRMLLGGNSRDIDINGHGSFRGRFGVAVERLHIYTTAGYGWGNVRLGGDVGPGPESRSVATSGLVYGSGLEFKVAPRLSLRAEALRTEMSGQWRGEDGTRVKLNSPMTEVRVGLTWHFNTLR